MIKTALVVIQSAVQDVHAAHAVLGTKPKRMDEKMAFVMEWSVDDVSTEFARHVDLNLPHLNAVLESIETGWPYGMWGRDLKGYLRDEEKRLRKAREINEGEKSIKRTKADFEKQLARNTIAMEAAARCSSIYKAKKILRKELNHGALREAVK